MRVVVVGGTGAQGKAAVQTVLRRNTVDEILVVARHADRVTSEDANARVHFAAVDVIDTVALTRILEKGDLVLNAAAPFFRLKDYVAQAAIAAGADYADICDDWEATESILALDHAARSAGSRIITGFGGAPGIDSMLAKIAMSELDTVTEIITAWPLRGGGGGEIQSLVPFIHLMQCAVGPIRLLRHGAMVLEKPLQELPFKHPKMGESVAYTIGSPEAITLHRREPACQLNANLMFAGTGTIGHLISLADNVRAGALSLDDAARYLASPDPTYEPIDEPIIGDLLGWASGLKNGQRIAVAAELVAFPRRSYASAGVALGLAADFHPKAAMCPPGAYSIEDVLQPLDYLNALANELGGEARVEVSHCAV
jgi:hypothetical protein